MMSFNRIFLVLPLLALTTALDVEVSSLKCDRSLYVTADFSIRCNGNKKCTFGQSVANVKGFLHYNNVEKSGIKYNMAYLTTDLSLLGQKYNVEEMRPVNLCNYVTGQNSNSYDCPGDGTYGFQVEYPLPSVAGSDAASNWLASGFAGTGTLALYAEMNENMKIGECTFTMQTYTSKTSKFSVPEAASVAGVVLGVVGALIVAYFLVQCQLNQRKKKITTKEFINRLSCEDITTIWKKLDDDTRSIVIQESRSFATTPSMGLEPRMVQPVPSMPQTASIVHGTPDTPPPEATYEAPRDTTPSRDMTPAWVGAAQPEEDPKKPKSGKSKTGKTYVEDCAL